MSFAYSFDQTLREREPLPPASLGTAHSTTILLVIHAEQMQHAMQHQDLDLFRQGMTELGRLFRCAVDGNRDLAEKTAGHPGRKREHVGRIIVAEKTSVQSPEFAIIGKKAFETGARPQPPRPAVQQTCEVLRAAIRFRRDERGL